ncbi:MAG: PIN domain-containing protein [Sedimenticola sp.]
MTPTPENLKSAERAISSVTYIEYVPFCRNKKELKNFERIVEALHFRIYEIDSDISTTARKYVKKFSLSHRVEMGDALIAATAIKYNEVLSAGNIKHFEIISGIKLHKYLP